MLITKKCKYCLSEFQTLTNRIYCSQKCFRRWRSENWHPTEESNKRRSIAIKNKIKERGNWGRPFKKEHKLGFIKGFTPWNKNTIGCQEAWNKGLVMKNYYDEEQYKKFIDGCIKGGVSCNLKLGDKKRRTGIEIKIEQLLKQLGIRFFAQYPLLGITVSDFYLPDHHIVIYCDGDYWHNYPFGTTKDHQVEKELINNHYKVLRYWECEINKNTERIKEKIIEELQRLQYDPLKKGEGIVRT